MSSTTSNWLDASSTSNLSIQTYIQGFLDISGGNIMLRNNNFYVKTGDVSLGGRLFVARDLSINGNLYIGENTIAANAIIGGAGTGGTFNSTLTTTADTSLNGRLFVEADSSLNGNLVVGKRVTSAGLVSTGATFTGPVYGTTVATTGAVTAAGLVTANAGLTVATGATFTGPIYGTGATFSGAITAGGALTVTADSSLNGNLTLGGNLVVNGELTIKEFTQSSIINTITTNVFNVSEDLSLNGRLLVSSDAILNGRLYVSGDARINGVTLGLGGGAIGTNAAFGSSALPINTSGLQNNAFGTSSMNLNTTGSYNNAFGSNALASNVASNFNCAFGQQTLQLTTGANNTGFGYAAGHTNTSGTNNTYLGSNANATVGTWSNSTAIGYNSSITASNQIVLGTASETVSIPGNLSVRNLLTLGSVASELSIFGNNGAPFTVYGTVTSQVATALATFKNNFQSSQSIVNDPTPILQLQRAGTYQNAYNSAVNFNLCRYTSGNANAATRFDIALANAQSGYPDTTVMTMLGTGNVGIGTNNPGATLQLTSATPQLLMFPSGTAVGQTSAILFAGTFGSSSGTADTGARYTAQLVSGFAPTATWGGEYLAFNVGNGGTANDAKAFDIERMRISGSGNVGIGTTAPAFALDVSAGTGTKFHSLFVNAQSDNGTFALGNYRQNLAGTFGTGFALYQGSGGDTVVNAQSGQTIGFKINNNTVATVNSTGLGIGTTNPQATLDVTGGIRVSGGITPTYSTPSFGSGQVGYITTGTVVNNSILNNTPTMVRNMIIAQPGIYLIESMTLIEIMSADKSMSISITFPNGGGSMAANTRSVYFGQTSHDTERALTGIATITGSNTQVNLVLFQNTGVTRNVARITFQATRIA